MKILNESSCSSSKEEETLDLINLNSNDYLGFAEDLAVMNAGEEAINNFGTGVVTRSMSGGASVVQRELQRKLAKFHCREDAIVYGHGCGMAANMGLFQALLHSGDLVFSDENNHFSISDGLKLTEAQVITYQHLNMEDLEAKLCKADPKKVKIIATDGVFLKDATICPLPNLYELAQKYDATLFLDECHAIGVIGPTGRGTEEHFNIVGAADIINSTLANTLAGATSSYTTGSEALVSLLRRKFTQFEFTAACNPIGAACAAKALDLINGDQSRLDQLRMKTIRFRQRMMELGFELMGDIPAICLIMLRDNMTTLKVADYLTERGFLTTNHVTPACREGEQNIRVIINASHTEEDINRALEAFREAKNKLLDRPV